MTENEALYCLKAGSERHSELCKECYLYGKTGCDHCYDDATDIAIKALEKQIPKKVIDKNENEYTLDFICPSCNEPTIGQPYRPNYCKHCGCKLDFE